MANLASTGMTVAAPPMPLRRNRGSLEALALRSNGLGTLDTLMGDLLAIVAAEWKVREVNLQEAALLQS